MRNSRSILLTICFVAPLGPVRVLAPPVKLDGGGFQPGAPTPTFASQTRAILGELGFDAPAIDALLAARVTRAS